MSSYRLDIPRWQPTTLNRLFQCGHWGQRAHLKRLDREMVAGYALAAGIPKASTKRRVTLMLVMGPRQRRCDPDAPLKSLLDALVSCGLLVDDSPRWVEVAPVQYVRGKERGCVVTLEDLLA